MTQQDRFQLGRRDLHPLVFDELFDPIDDEDVAVGIDVAHVTGMQPAFFVDRRCGSFGVAQVAVHDQRPANPDLALLAALQCVTGRSDDHAFGIRD